MKKRVLIIVILIITVLGLSYNYFSDRQETVVYQENTELVEVINYDELLDYLNLFQPGDIINIENTNYLSSYAIPGRWKHTIFYLGTYQQFTDFFTVEDNYYQEILSKYQTFDEILVLDSNSTGVKIRNLDQMANLKSDSYLKALSGYRFNEESSFIKNYLNKALDYLGTPYDYGMVTYDDSALYCSELIYYALLANNIEITQTTTVIDRNLITPSNVSDFLETQSNVEHVYLLEKKNGQVINQC